MYPRGNYHTLISKNHLQNPRKIMLIKTPDQLEITVSLVADLIAEQFPHWSHLSIKPVAYGGHDNRTFHLGEEMLIRLPSAEKYAAKVQIEQKWLPLLAPHLSYAIPQPIAMGNPSQQYPWHWSIYRWLEGNSANTLYIDDIHLSVIAAQLAQFLNELHKIPPMDGPTPGLHNFYRGDSLEAYDSETQHALVHLHGIVDVDTITDAWKQALSSQWSKSPVWIHGDLSVGNILIKDNRLTAVIDFGGMGVGDPACDLVIAWIFLKQESRQIFKSLVNLDRKTWERAQGWALWKALITLVPLQDVTCAEAVKQKQIIEDIIAEHLSKGQ